MDCIHNYKTIALGPIRISYLFFKNLPRMQWEALTDEVSSYLFEHQASGIISTFIAGNESQVRDWNKAMKNGFGEVNWTELWHMMADENGSENLSGYFTIVEGQKMKTISGSSYICKIIDAQDLRLCFVGTNPENRISCADAKEATTIQSSLESGLLFAGMQLKHLLNLKFYSEKLPVVSKESHIWFPMVSSKKPMDSFYTMALENNASGLSQQQINDKQTDGDSQATIYSDAENQTLFLSAQQKEASAELWLNELSQKIGQHGFEWNHCQRGIMYYSDKKNLKLFKELSKQMHVPLAPLLFVPMPENHSSSWIFDGDFSSSRTQ